MKLMTYWMNVILAVGVVTLLSLSMVRAEEEYVPPTDEQVAEIAANPALLRDYIADTTVDQTADLLIRVIQQVESLDMDWAAKQDIVGDLFRIVYEMKGALADAIIAQVRKKVNPRLLPVIPQGSTAPPSSPKYPRQ